MKRRLNTPEIKNVTEEEKVEMLRIIREFKEKLWNTPHWDEVAPKRIDKHLKRIFADLNRNIFKDLKEQNPDFDPKSLKK